VVTTGTQACHGPAPASRFRAESAAHRSSTRATTSGSPARSTSRLTSCSALPDRSVRLAISRRPWRRIARGHGISGAANRNRPPGALCSRRTCAVPVHLDLRVHAASRESPASGSSPAPGRDLKPRVTQRPAGCLARRVGVRICAHHQLHACRTGHKLPADPRLPPLRQRAVTDPSESFRVSSAQCSGNNRSGLRALVLGCIRERQLIRDIAVSLDDCGCRVRGRSRTLGRIHRRPRMSGCLDKRGCQGSLTP
jgi:hypothetical protein